MRILSLCSAVLVIVPAFVSADDIKQTELYHRIKASIDAVPAIDTHDHLRAFEELPNRVQTPQGRGMTLFSIWSGSYYRWTNPLSPWPKDGKFESWWAVAHDDFENARATSFYRYMLPAFRDLYGVNFDTITAAQARQINDQIFEHYKDDRWLNEVVTKKANIELMFIDPYWARLQFAREYKYSVPLLNVTTMMSGHHPSKFATAVDSPYAYAKQHGLKTDTLDDYLTVIDAIFQEAVRNDAVCLKSTQAYQRTLAYKFCPKERAEKVYGRKPEGVSTPELRAFEDFMFARVCELSAKYDLPFQVHTGQARVQGSNPLLLVDMIENKPQTKFILFHGGYPWVGETAVIAMRHRNVWIDSCWLPTLSYTMAKRAYQEWLEAVPSDRIMWGADTVNAEGIYAATEFTRRCLAEALAEKVERGELLEQHANRIGRQVMRDNALKLFPRLKRWLWRQETAKK